MSYTDSSIPCAQPNGAASAPSFTPMAIPTAMSLPSSPNASKVETKESSTLESDTPIFSQYAVSPKHCTMSQRMANSLTSVPSPPGGLSGRLKRLLVSPETRTSPSTFEHASKRAYLTSMRNGFASWQTPKPQSSTVCTSHSSNGSAQRYASKSFRKTSVPYLWAQRGAANQHGPSVSRPNQLSGSRKSMTLSISVPPTISQLYLTICHSHTGHLSHKST